MFKQYMMDDDDYHRSTNFKCPGNIACIDGRYICVCRKCGHNTTTMEAFKFHMEVDHGKYSRQHPMAMDYNHPRSMESARKPQRMYRVESIEPKMKIRRVDIDRNPYDTNGYRKFKRTMMMNNDGHQPHAGPKGKKNLACAACPVKFRDMIELNEHTIKCHPKNRNGNNCVVCNKFYASRKGLLNHIGRFHADEFPFECTMCPVRFETNKELLFHKQSKHVTGKIIDCDRCDGKFVTAYERAKHNKEVHSNCIKSNIAKHMEYTTDTESTYSGFSRNF